MTGTENKPANPAEKPDIAAREPVAIHLISGNANLFVIPYMLLCFFFSLCVVFAALAAVVLALAGAFEKGHFGQIFALFKRIAAFDFGNSALKGETVEATNAVMGAYGLAALAALVLLAILFGAGLKILKGSKIKRNYSILALLPGRKRGVIPCSEGVYKLMYANFMTNNKYYSFFPWEKLTLYAIDENRKRIVLRAGKTRMPVIPYPDKAGKTDPFGDLKAVVRRHLPENNQLLPAKKIRYRWVRCVITLAILLALQFALAFWLEAASIQGNGSETCDVGGPVHIYYRTDSPYGEIIHTFLVYDSDNQVVHTYCELHGICYESLHPTLLIRTLGTDNMKQILADPVLVMDMLVIPVSIWLLLILFVALSGKPPVYRFGRL